VVHHGSSTSAELDLPVPIIPGQIDIKVQRGHFELKLSTPSTNIQLNPTSDPIPLLDASQLSISNPTSFVCASCSLPIVQSSKISSYRDLPSEHWEELVDAWMCHTDQNLHEHVTKHSRGFWPDAGQALIGGSYILFEESSVVKTNLFPAQQPKVSSGHFLSFFLDDQEDRRWLFTDGCPPLELALLSVDDVKPSQVSRLTRWLWLALRGCNKLCFRLIQSVLNDWRLRQ
jgi:hypothetical protein